MTQQILKWLWQVSVQASVLIVALWLLRLLFAGKISARLRYALWGLVLIRLFVPITVSSPVSIMNGAQPVTQAVERIFIVQDTMPQDETPVNQGQINPPAEQTRPNAATPGKAAVSTAALVQTMWVGGAGILLLLTITSNVRFRLRCKRTRKRVEVDTILWPLAKRLGLKKLPVVYECGTVASACVVGLWNPSIYLPSAQLTETQCRHILLHELCHIKRQDNFWAVMRGVCCVLYWFNPLIWLAGYYAHRDCELACDERVLAKLGTGEREAYGMTLVSQLKKGPPAFSAMQVTATLTMGKKEMKERIVRIARHKKTALSATILAVLLAVVAVAAACTNTPSAAGNKTTGEPTPAHTPVLQTPAVSVEPSAAAVKFALLPDRESFRMMVPGTSKSATMTKFVFQNLLALYLDGDSMEYLPPTGDANCGTAVLKEAYRLGEDNPSPEIAVSFRDNDSAQAWLQHILEIEDPSREIAHDRIGGYPCIKVTTTIGDRNDESYAINYKGGFILIHLKYFEAYAEGWAARMRQLLDTLVLNEDIDGGQIVLLLSEPAESQVSIAVAFTENAHGEWYYVPDDTGVQTALISRLQGIETQPLTPMWWEGAQPLGYGIVYDGKRWELWTGNTLVSHMDYVRATAPEICGAVEQIVKDKLGITPFDPGGIKGIVSARLDVQFYGTEKQYTQTVTDPQALAEMEALLSDAVHSDAGCPFREGYLTMTLESGETVLLAMGTDSCTTYYVNGMMFDYRPAALRGKEDTGADNSIIFKYFDQIPIETRGQ